MLLIASWQRLCRDCYTIIARGAPQEFQLLVNEVSNLSNPLQILRDDVTDVKDLTEVVPRSAFG